MAARSTSKAFVRRTLTRLQPNLYEQPGDDEHGADYPGEDPATDQPTQVGDDRDRPEDDPNLERHGRQLEAEVLLVLVFMGGLHRRRALVWAEASSPSSRAALVPTNALIPIVSATLRLSAALVCELMLSLTAAPESRFEIASRPASTAIMSAARRAKASRTWRGPPSMASARSSDLRASTARDPTQNRTFPGPAEKGLATPRIDATSEVNASAAREEYLARCEEEACASGGRDADGDAGLRCPGFRCRRPAGCCDLGFARLRRARGGLVEDRRGQVRHGRGQGGPADDGALRVQGL